MGKAKLLLLLPLLLCACHSRRTPPPAPQTALSQIAPAPAPATAALPVQTPAPQPSITPAPAATQPRTTERPTAPVPAKAQPPAPAQERPAPDKPAFEDEELIDLDGRLLHPYAALTPDPLTAQEAPWAYEQLKYGIYYSFIKAGTAYIRNRGLVSINGRPAYMLQTTAFSAPVIDAFFKVRDINQSWLDAENFYSLGYGQSVREGSYKRDEWAVFDYAAGQYRGQIQKKESPRPLGGALDMKVLDMLTSLYYVRAQELTPGTDIIFDIVNREKQYPLVVKVIKKETVKVSAGTFKCILVEPQLRGEGIFVAKGKSLKVWLTDDEYKIPVKMKVEVFIGSVSAELLEFKRQEPANIL